MSFTINIEKNNILRVGFGEPAANDQIVRDAGTRVDKLIWTGSICGGKLLQVNGPGSTPVTMLLRHKLVHLYETVACYDPKPGCYVVIAAHGGEHTPGDLVN